MLKHLPVTVLPRPVGVTKIPESFPNAGLVFSQQRERSSCKLSDVSGSTADYSEDDANQRRVHLDMGRADRIELSGSIHRKPFFEQLAPSWEYRHCDERRDVRFGRRRHRTPIL
jgi:hypothetical protein